MHLYLHRVSLSPGLGLILSITHGSFNSVWLCSLGLLLTKICHWFWSISTCHHLVYDSCSYPEFTAPHGPMASALQQMTWQSIIRNINGNCRTASVVWLPTISTPRSYSYPPIPQNTHLEGLQLFALQCGAHTGVSYHLYYIFSLAYLLAVDMEDFVEENPDMPSGTYPERDSE